MGTVKAAVDAPGARVVFEGSLETWERTVLPLLGPLARGEWREGALPPVPPEGPADPDAAPAPAPAPAAAPSSTRAAGSAPAAVASPPRPTAPAAPHRAAAPASPASPAPGTAAAWDPAPLYARLLAEKGRKAERDAVLLALVSLAAAGRRDASPADVLSHMKEHGYPAAGVKAKPVLAKLCHRKGMAVPGLLPNTFRATPAGSAYIWRRAKGG